MGLRLGHYRLIWPAEVLRDQGYDVDVVRPGVASGIGGTMVNDELVSVHIDSGADADVFVFQRPTNQVLVELIRILRQRGRTVVIDMDDDLTCIHPKNAAFSMLHPKLSPRNNWQHAQEACRIASLVTVSTPELQRKYGTQRSRVLRNCIPARFLEIPRPDVELTWGWAGALHSHPDDLPLIGGAVAELNRLGYEFRIVGYTEGTGRALGLSSDPKGTGRVEFDDWASELSRLAVGVAPLTGTKFNVAKSHLKPLEYASLGVPWVGSDRAEYRALYNFGAGFVVGDRTRDWVRTVRRLLDDDALRTEASEACRAVAAQLTIEQHAWRWMETWEFARELDRQVATRRPTQSSADQTLRSPQSASIPN